MIQALLQLTHLQIFPPAQIDKVDGFEELTLALSSTLIQHSFACGKYCVHLWMDSSKVVKKEII